MTNRPWQPKHLPYQLDPGNRWHYYENFWKEVGLNLLIKHCPASREKTVLDYGCGRGEGISVFSAAGYKVTGTDVDSTCVNLSSQFGEALRLQAENPISQFGRKSFDVVTCFHVLEHVENPKRTLSDLAEIAKSYVIIAVPNLRQLHHPFTRSIELDAVNEGHLQSWDHWHLLNLAERHCGLKLIEWAADATQLPILSNLAAKLLGKKRIIALETGLFRRLFPFHSISVIGLFQPL